MLEELRPQLEVAGRAERRVDPSAGLFPQRAAPEGRLLLDERRRKRARAAGGARRAGSRPAVTRARGLQRIGSPRSSQWSREAASSATAPAGAAAKISPTTWNAHGVYLSSELSHAITSPLVRAKPLLIASYWPASRSLTHAAKSVLVFADHVHALVGAAAVDDDVLELRVVLVQHRLHRLAQEAALVEARGHDADARQRRRRPRSLAGAARWRGAASVCAGGGHRGDHKSEPVTGQQNQ